MIRYEPAVANDYEQILKLNELAIPAVNRIGVPELSSLHRQAKALIVARAEGDIAGFLLVLDESADYQSVNYQYFKNHYDQFAYVDRIVVSDQFRRMGIGLGLYEQLFALSGDSPRIACEVNVVPPNPGSLKFHASLGFLVVDEQDTDQGAKRVALMVRSNAADPAQAVMPQPAK